MSLFSGMSTVFSIHTSALPNINTQATRAHCITVMYHLPNWQKGLMLLLHFLIRENTNIDCGVHGNATIDRNGKKYIDLNRRWRLRLH